MSVSFQSGSAGSAGTVSQESSPQQAGAHQSHHLGHHQPHHQHPPQHHQYNRQQRKVTGGGGVQGDRGGQSTQL